MGTLIAVRAVCACSLGLAPLRVNLATEARGSPALCVPSSVGTTHGAMCRHLAGRTVTEDEPSRKFRRRSTGAVHSLGKGKVLGSNPSGGTITGRESQRVWQADCKSVLFGGEVRLFTDPPLRFCSSMVEQAVDNRPMRGPIPPGTTTRACSWKVELLPLKQLMRVRFPPSPPIRIAGSKTRRSGVWIGPKSTRPANLSALVAIW